MSDASEQHPETLLDHLLELKRRLTWAVGSVFVGFLVSYPFKARIFDFLSQPLVQVMEKYPDSSMQITGPAESFVTFLKICLLSGLVLAIPVVLYQFWAFVAPGLYRSERRVFFPVLLLSIFLFLVGASFSFFLVFPLAFDFLLGMVPPELGGGVESNIRMGEYFSFSLTLLLAFGASFQVPIICMALVRLGMVTVQGLRAKRRYVFAGAFILAALITPPDVISQVLLGFPVWLLYELGIILSTRIKTRSAEDDEVEEGGS